MDPCQIAIGAGEVIQLRLLAHPKDAIGHHAHEKNDETRRQHHQCMPQVALGVDRLAGRYTQVEHQQRHGDRENAVAQGRQALHALPGNAVV